MRKHVHGFLFALTVVAALACAPTTPTLEKHAAPGITNLTRLDGVPTFAGSLVGFGGATEPSAMSWLRSEGFETVISLRSASEDGADIEGSRAAAEAAGLNYIHLPFDPASPEPDVVNKFLAAAGAANNQPVYIHCGSATRVAALWMVGRVLEDGLEIDAASKEAEAIAMKPADAIAFATKYLAAAKN
jgi:uncharacterized protein (TIGR01244 family)